MQTSEKAIFTKRYCYGQENLLALRNTYGRSISICDKVIHMVGRH